MKFHLFNPENDLALADFSAHYTPPKIVRQLAESGSLLPCWFADREDCIGVSSDVLAQWTGSSCSIPWWREVIEKFDFNCRIAETCPSDDFEPSPWGWSPAVADKFLKAGVNKLKTPNQARLNGIRELSHRRTSLLINERLKPLGIDTPETAIEIDSLPDFINSALAKRRVMMKSPWSSSGRGVFDSTHLSSRQVAEIVTGTIARQGSIIIEPYLDRIADFAMLFESKEGMVEFVGYSLFESSPLGAYSGNVIDSQDKIVKRICDKGIEIGQLDAVRNALIEVMPCVIGNRYDGRFGIDMMIYRDNDFVTRIAPCVEINLRNTMGFVALALAERHLHEDSAGIFTVGHCKMPDPDCPPTIVSGKLVSGMVDLTIPNSNFTFMFSATKSAL